jgi:hypothetical protein
MTYGKIDKYKWQQSRGSLEMDVEYKKDLRHNYMVIAESDEQKIEPYCIKMLEHQSIDGILPMEQQRMDNRILFYYDITAKQSMINLFDKTILSFDRVKQLLGYIIQTMERAYEHLLSEDDFILSPEYIYLDITTNHPYLCFYCGYHKSIKEQMNGLIEYLMNKVDYNDKDAVLLVYQLYAVSREEGFTFEHLVEVLQKQTGQALENKNSRVEIAFGERKLEEDYQSSEKMYREGNQGRFATLLQDKTQDKYVNQQNQSNQNRPQGIGLKDLQPKNFKEKESRLKDIRLKDIRLKDIKLRDIKLKDIKLKDARRKDIGIKEIKHDIKRNSSLQYEIPEKQEKKDFGMPVMMERLEGEEEIPCYSFKTYIFTIASILGGLIVISLGYASKILYNTFGNRMDYSKLFAMFLMVFCVEGYLLNKIWDKKNKITKIVTKKEYIDPRKEQDNVGTVYSRKSTNLYDTENDQIYQNSNISLPNKDCNTASDQQKMNIEVMKTKISNKEELPEQEDFNPTCLLNESYDRTTPILKSLEEANYKDIPIGDFPFFIGKLKKNVDYCLEKDVVSRFHAKITKEQEQYYITDLNSKNGTFVNQEVVQTYQKMEIKIGDEIAFANIKYQFTLCK